MVGVKQARNFWRIAGALVLALLIVGHITAQSGSRQFNETGQRLDNQYGFLQFWESHNGAMLYGPPITGIVLEANVPVQYFERGRLEYRNGAAAPGALGRERTRWRQFAAAVPHSEQADELVFRETGHTITGAFLRFWRDNNGAVVFGPPLSEPMWESIGGSSMRVQYFERARLEEQSVSESQAVAVSSLGREIALAKGLVLPDQQPAVSVVQAGSAGGVEGAFAELAPPTPTPVPPTAPPLPTATSIPPTPTAVPAAAKPAPANAGGSVAPDPTRAKPRPTSTPLVAPTTAPKPAVARVAGKVIDVNLSTQRFVAMENGVVVRRAGVSSGRDGFNTPTGTYNIYYKLKLQTMRGSLNGISWVVPNVPNVMYINGSVALHGTYWHNLFGTGARLSHGCINLSLKDAEWMYGWAPMGTTVVVHY